MWAAFSFLRAAFYRAHNNLDSFSRFRLYASERETSLSPHDRRSDDGTDHWKVRQRQSRLSPRGAASRPGQGLAAEAAASGSTGGRAGRAGSRARHHRHRAAPAPAARGGRDHCCPAAGAPRGVRTPGEVHLAERRLVVNPTPPGASPHIPLN